MENFKTRLTEERKQLHERLTLLQTFIMESPVFPTLDISEQDRLKRQHEAMLTYLIILDERIAFNKGN